MAREPYYPADPECESPPQSAPARAPDHPRRAPGSRPYESFFSVIANLIEWFDVSVVLRSTVNLLTL